MVHRCETFRNGVPQAYFGAPCTPVEEQCALLIIFFKSALPNSLVRPIDFKDQSFSKGLLEGHKAQFLESHVCNKITDGNPSKPKFGIVIVQQGATSVKSLRKEITSVRIFGRGPRTIKV